MPKPTTHATALLALLALLALTTHAEPLHVPGQFPTIQSAIDAAQPGDEIHIAPGTYRELLAPENKSLTLIGAGPGQTILSGDLDADATPDGIILEYKNELVDVLPFITLRNLTMTDAEIGLRFARAADIEIDSCDLTRCSGTGIQQFILQYGNDICRDLILTRCNFSGPGSGVRITNANSVRVHDSAFKNMTRGSLDISSITAEISDTDFIGQASEAKIDAKSGHILNCTFQHNTGSVNHYPPATALEIHVTEPFTIESCRFIANGNPHSGPTLDVTGGRNVISILACEFTDNRGSFESAVAAGGTFRFENCTFTGNVAEGVGPINLSTTRGSISTIARCTFIDNGEALADGTYLPGGGGGFCIESGMVYVSDCVFRENIASSAGAIMVISSDGGCVVERSTFFANRASNTPYSSAGAIYAGNSRFPRKRLAVTNSVFIGNSAGNNPGGAIVATNDATISNCVFIANHSKSGSVVYYEQGRPSLQSVHPSLLTACIVVPVPGAAPFESNFGPISVSNAANLLTTNPHAPRFTRLPSHGGDGFGDDPRTPHIDESLNDDFGNLTLLPGSPAIDAGGNAKLPRDTSDLDLDGDTLELLVGTLDLAGNPRFLDDPATPNLHDPAGQWGPIDFGPYEFVPTPLRRYIAPAAH